MALTITIPGAVEATIGATAPAVLTVGVGTPGATGPAGAAGPGVPVGGTAGQFLTKIDSTNYNTDWTTVNLSVYAVKANNLSDLASASTARTNLGLGTMSTATAADYSTTTVANGLYYPLSGNPSAFLIASALSPYLLSATAASTYATIAAGQPTSGTVGQVLTKNSGTNYDSSWATLIPGDRYLTSSTTSLTIANGAKTLTVGTGLSYSSQQDVVIAYDAANHMHAVVTSYNSSTGALVVDVQNKTGSGTYAVWTVNVGGTVPLQSVSWGEIIGTLGNQTDLATALNAKLETSTAASTYAPLAGAVFTGEVSTPASTTSSAGFSILPGVAPTSPTNGEFWNTGSDLQVRLGGVTETLAEQSWVTGQGYLTSSALSPYLLSSTAASTYQTISGMSSYLTTSAASTTYAAKAGTTFTGLVTTVLSATTGAGFNLPHGAAPTTPVNGDIWTTTSGLFARINGGTQQYAPLGSTNTFTGTNTFSGATLSFGTSTAASTINVGTGATLTATTKAVNIGTSGVAGSTTNIAIGSTTGTSTTTLQGTTNGITAAVDTNSVALATTAYVVGQAGSATPVVDGTAAVGTSLRYARQDHVHPTDTSRAATASPTFTGTPLSTTAAADTNTTQIATTAFVVGQASSTAPVIDGTATVGTSLKYARADHVHPTDTSRAALASPTFTGVPLAPTAAVDTNTTQLATTAYVIGQGYLKSATASTTYAPLASPSLTGVPLAPTATVGTNTTQIATTAFVTAAVPAFATRAQVIEPSSTTLVVSPLRLIDVVTNPGYVQIAQNNGNVATSTSGAGASNFTTSMTRVCIGPNSLTAGSSYYRPQTNGGVAQFYAKGSNLALINFSKPFWMSGRSLYDDTFIGDANNTSRITVGKSGTGAGALAQKGIGWEKNGGSAAFFKLLAHNGTSLTTVTTSTSLSSLGISGGVPFDWSIYSDGAGNVTLFINDVQVATTSAGPTGNSAGSSVWQEEIDQTVTAATRMYFTTFGGHYYHA